MIEQAYLERAAQDIAARATTVELNSQPVTIKSITANGTTVTILTDMIAGTTQITSLRLLDELGQVITQRTPYINVTDSQRLEFRFEFEVKGGVSSGF